MSIYTRKEKEIPFNVVEVDNTNFDEEEKCWTIDAFGSGERAVQRRYDDPCGR